MPSKPTTKKHDGQVRAWNEFLRAIDCEACGYAHLDPLPTQAQLNELYTDAYYRTYNSGWFDKEKREQWYWRAVYKARLAYAADIGMINKRVLDYGAGCGWFVRTANALGFAAAGYEPNRYAVRYAHNHVTACVSDVAEWRDGGLVHLSLVLEHILDPLLLLRELYARMPAGGLVCIVVPNEFNPHQYEIAGRWGYSPLHEHHVNYFTPASLVSLAERAGFSIVRRTATFPMELFALRGFNYVRTPGIGGAVHWMRMAIEWVALNSYPRAWDARRDRWAAQGVGREIELWLRKPIGF